MVAFAVMASIAAAYVLYAFDPATHAFPQCPFYSITGFFCPGCGSQRAIHHLLHGHLLAAAGNNMLLVVVLPLLLLHAAAWLANRLGQKQFPLVFEKIIAAKWVMLVVIVFWLMRNVPLQPFAWLAPDLVS